MIRAIGKSDFHIENLSNADDTVALQKCLDAIQKCEKLLNVGHAGSTFRFLCAYLSGLENSECVLEGSEQLHHRPVKPLVDGLCRLGADITYLKTQDYPPLSINGKKLPGGMIEIDSDISSQFISALMLISPMLQSTLHLKLKGKTVSTSYIKLTEQLMKQFGVTVNWIDEKECVLEPQTYRCSENSFFNESDWSGAGYFYSAMALNNTDNVLLNGLFEQSIQPDAIAKDLFKTLGVETVFNSKGAFLKKIPLTQNSLNYDFSLCPDLAQAAVVCCAGLGISVHFTGLSTLIIKETNRLLALKNELAKIGITAHITDDSLTMNNPNVVVKGPVSIQTYHDHRMAMCFAPLALKFPNIKIVSSEVVSKSFPSFWEEFKKLIPL
jgi:3-phosphoshikimate 1-carboxyvinyltransferase